MALSPLAEMLQMQQPLVPHTPTQVAPTDVTGAYKLATDAANFQYAQKLAQQNAMWGGLAGIGGAGIAAGGKAFGPALAAKLFPATSTTAGAPLPLLGSAAPASNALDTTMLGYDASAVPGATAAADAGGTAATGSPLATLMGGGATDAAGAGLADAGALGAGTVGADIAATAAPAATDAGATGLAALLGGTGAAAGADASGMTLADLLPLLFAA